MIRFVVFDNHPWVLVNETNDGVKLQGEFKCFFDYLIRSLNLSWELKVPEFPGGGTEISPGIWTGAMGMISQNKADVIFQPFGVDAKRFTVADFTSSFASTHYSILSTVNRNTQDSMFFSLDSVHLEVWLVLGAFLISLSLIFYWTDHIENCISLGRQGFDLQRDNFKFFKYLYVFSAVLILKAVDGCQSRTLGRHLLIFSWSYGVVIFVAAISSSIVSRLTMAVDDDRIDHLSHIIRYPTLTPIAVEDTVALEYIRKSTDENLQQLWNQILKNGGQVSVKAFDGEPVVKKVIDGRAVLISNVEILIDIAKSHCTEAHFHLAKEGFLSVFVTMMINRALPPAFKEQMNLRVLHYTDVGLMARAWDPPLLENKTCVADSTANDGIALRFRDLSVSFRLWLIGFMTSFGLIVIESVYNVIKIENQPSRRQILAKNRVQMM